MKKLLLLSLIISASVFAGGKIRSLDITTDGAQVYQENGIILNITGEAAKYMFLKGLDINGTHDTYSNEEGDYHTITAMYGELRCSKSSFDRSSWVPGESISYKCVLGYNDSEVIN